MSKKEKANIGKPKELWKTLKVRKIPNKVFIATVKALKDDKVVKYDPFQRFFKRSLSIWQKHYYWRKFPLPPNKYDIDSVKFFYKDLKKPLNSN